MYTCLWIYVYKNLSMEKMSEKKIRKKKNFKLIYILSFLLYIINLKISREIINIFLINSSLDGIY